MNNKRELDRSFLALAHPVRRGIVERLSLGPSTVATATAGLGASKPAISRHLKVLEEAGVLVREVEGRSHRLSLDRRPLDGASAWIERHRTIWEAKFEAVAEHLDATGPR